MCGLLNVCVTRSKRMNLTPLVSYCWYKSHAFQRICFGLEWKEILKNEMLCLWLFLLFFVHFGPLTRAYTLCNKNHRECDELILKRMHSSQFSLIPILIHSSLTLNSKAHACHVFLMSHERWHWVRMEKSEYGGKGK